MGLSLAKLHPADLSQDLLINTLHVVRVVREMILTSN